MEEYIGGRKINQKYLDLFEVPKKQDTYYTLDDIRLGNYPPWTPKQLYNKVVHEIIRTQRIVR